jgi:S-methylmethionine-dependent homocysteine/selenocysteine methylase
VSFLEPDGGVLVTDGGLATELEARGHDLSDSLWSARLLVDAPAEIAAAHLAFFRAAAVIATTASCQASFGGSGERGVGRADAARLMRRGVELARGAERHAAHDGPKICVRPAGSGPAAQYPGPQSWAAIHNAAFLLASAATYEDALRRHQANIGRACIRRDRMPKVTA